VLIYEGDMLKLLMSDIFHMIIFVFSWAYIFTMAILHFRHKIIKKDYIHYIS